MAKAAYCVERTRRPLLPKVSTAEKSARHKSPERALVSRRLEIEIVSWHVMMSIGQVEALRVPAERLRDARRAIKQSAWSTYRTEFYPTDDYKPIAESEHLGCSDRGCGSVSRRADFRHIAARPDCPLVSPAGIEPATP